MAPFELPGQSDGAGPHLDRVPAGFEPEIDVEAVSAGWPAVCANLKSLLETGHVLPRAPWEMHAGQRAAQMARNDPS